MTNQLNLVIARPSPVIIIEKNEPPSDGRICMMCNEYKILTDLVKGAKYSKGYKPLCMACNAGICKQSYYNNREARLQYQREYYIKKKERNN